MHRDKSIVYEIYGKEFGPKKPELFASIINGFEKLLKGIFFRKRIFGWKWTAINVSDLNLKNSKYIK
jgi:hypothetical protein